jgi:hypothetical protein
MKIRYSVFSVAFGFLFIAGTSNAQTIVVTQPSVQFSDTQFANTVIRERRNGAKVESAELDICFQVAANGPVDRAVIELKPQGTGLSGAGVSLRAKTPVEFSYSGAYQNDQLTYNGKVKIGALSAPFSAGFVSENTEKQYQESLYLPPLVEKPADFLGVSPQWVAVRTKFGTVPALVDFLRKQDVALDALLGLVEDCDALRAGMHTVQFVVHPERAEAVIAAAKRLPDVLAAGWGGQSQMTYAVRMPAAPWLDNGKPDRKKLQAAISQIVSRALEGNPVSAVWDRTTGDLVLTLKRTSQNFPGLKVTETVEVAVLAEFERPGGADHLVLWVNSVKAVLADEAGAARVKIRPVVETGGEGIYIDAEPITKALARELNGTTWDWTTEKWN